MKEEWEPEITEIMQKVCNTLYNGDSIPFRDNGEEDFLITIKKLDEWFKRRILSNPNTRFCKDSFFPYKSHTHVENMLRKHGKEFVEQMIKECPVKQKSENRVYDSIAYIIFTNKIDISSLIKVPVFNDVWDKISDDGHV